MGKIKIKSLVEKMQPEEVHDQGSAFRGQRTTDNCLRSDNSDPRRGTLAHNLIKPHLTSFRPWVYCWDFELREDLPASTARDAEPADRPQSI